MMEELGEVDHWLDEFLKARPELEWSRIPRNKQAMWERSIQITSA